jgi:hypothetical protein
VNNCAEKFYQGHKNDKEFRETQSVLLEEEFDAKNGEFSQDQNNFESRIFIEKVEIDRGKNYKWYFPGDNLDQFVLNIRNQIFPSKKFTHKKRRRYTSPKKAGRVNSIVERKISSFIRASDFLNRGCVWFKKQWPLKK